MNYAMCIRVGIPLSLQAIYNKQSAEVLFISRFKVQVFYIKLEHTSTETCQVSKLWSLFEVWHEAKDP